MLRYYGRLIKRIPALVIGATDTLGNIVAFVILCLLAAAVAFNQAIGEQLNRDWLGISPWWVLAVIGAMVAYGLAKVNHKYVAGLETRVNAMQMVPRNRDPLVRTIMAYTQAAEACVRQSFVIEDIRTRLKRDVDDDDLLQELERLQQAKSELEIERRIAGTGFDRRLYLYEQGIQVAVDRYVHLQLVDVDSTQRKISDLTEDVLRRLDGGGLRC